MIQQSHFWALNQEKQKCMLTLKSIRNSISQRFFTITPTGSNPNALRKINGQALWYIHPHNGKVLCKVATNLFTYEYTQYK